MLLQSWCPCLPVGAFITPQLTSQSSQPSSANYLQCLRYSPSQLLRWNKNMGQKRTEAGMITLLGKKRNKEQVCWGNRLTRDDEEVWAVSSFTWDRKRAFMWVYNIKMCLYHICTVTSQHFPVYVKMMTLIFLSFQNQKNSLLLWEEIFWKKFLLLFSVWWT